MFQNNINNKGFQMLIENAIKIIIKRNSKK